MGFRLYKEIKPKKTSPRKKKTTKEIGFSLQLLFLLFAMND